MPTKRQAKTIANEGQKKAKDKAGSWPEYLKYRKERIDAGQPFVSFKQWRKQRGATED